MNNSIYPCLTLKGKIAAASAFYIDAFGNAQVSQTSPFVIQLEVHGQKIMLLNDGPTVLPNPSISFMVMTESAEETEQYWNKLITGGKVLMALDSYPWSSRYGWVEDQFGISWQIYTGTKADSAQKICPTMMFVGDRLGKAAEAVQFYAGLFPNSNLLGILNYSEEDAQPVNLVKHAQFDINGYTLMAMDSPGAHDFDFNDAVSLVVECDTQQEIDRYWEGLTANGGREVACGWLVDPYGISWQIIPRTLGGLMKDPERGQRVMNALMQMKKLIIADLENA